MTMDEYARSRNLLVPLIAQKMGVTRQAVHDLGVSHAPTLRTLEKVSKAMTELGAPTTVVDLVAALYEGAR